MKKKLYKSVEDRKLGGVCAGIAEYFDIDATLIRVAYALISFFTGGFGGLIVYFVLMAIIPNNPGYVDYDDNNNI